ncbi:hypothetical protein [Brumimicrobium aurantiacum]|uniref:RHS repeat protein n=1 Tax=Brumimicrobium aurantiacum TaxID=1737063 RepID=A0A3E1F1A9_9FLAO|nr:hypothetical protein [Brumimicrobium aurantiacum]RFC55612.1 hypothetical protein DXU93_01380 [Brumimicrobium aurantiacum]
MKTTIFTTFIFLTGITFAQNEVAYTYDDAGNRIKRESTGSSIIIQPSNNETTALENLSTAELIYKHSPIQHPKKLKFPC